MKRKVIIVDFEELIEREAKKFGGNASHIILPSKFKNKKCYIICSGELSGKGKQKDGE